MDAAKMKKIKTSSLSASLTKATRLGMNKKSITRLLTCLYLFFVSASTMAAEDISADAMLAMKASERLLLDVRTVEEYTKAHIPTSVNIPLSEIETNLTRLSDFKNSPVVVYCRSGVRAGKAIALLEDNGFTNVMHLEGDMMGWETENRPTNKLGN
ncbi:putative phage shock protein E [Glaciecola nitratireducens FR1064]|uniref:Putative phage shock protein E n=2 Tax=Brumicola TaxID=3160924 RepID=G4QJW5_GLANF|nr:putative phage shock protein E [Glaciecola nitratireducens FR1064]